eukprot:TRINITY_DN577_c0_g1_i2.p1 TRINITY_DN577_c0_g1~~TRINITY_DN577_c0_g1_i2.p1  ORF type:complete len:64 (-),score=2.07 TRINITY_DN577_c0_g1_i2:181-372(-)
MRPLNQIKYWQRYFQNSHKSTYTKRPQDTITNSIVYGFIMLGFASLCTGYYDIIVGKNKKITE